MLAATALSAQPFAKALAVSAAAPMGFSALDRWPNGRRRSCAKRVQDMHAQRLAEDIRADQLRREEVRC
jgi:RecG-like helicase